MTLVLIFDNHLWYNSSEMEKEFTAFWEWVEQRRKKLGIASIRQLESAAGLANGTLYSRMNSNDGPTVKIAKGLCKALSVSWIELWHHAGFIPELPEIVPDFQLAELCHTFQRLPAGDQATIVRLVKTLAGNC